MFNMNKFYCFTKIFIVLAICLFSAGNIQAQLTVQGDLTPEELAQTLVGSGVEISNVELVCPEGGAGTFNGEFSSIGMAEGIILTSGSINNALGPNNQGGASEGAGTVGDDDLSLLADDPTNDACYIEFDVVPFGDTLRFNYVFGSEEYLEYVDSFNDVFGFFISGPGYDGPYSNNAENIALIPGTAFPVTINNVNNEDNSEYFVCNGDPQNDCGPYFPEPDFNSTHQYDGHTVVLTAIAPVTPCETYRLKLAVADAVDTALDSGVFIEARSLAVDIVTVTASTTLTTIDGFDYTVEDCVDGIITFSRDFGTSQDLTVEFTIQGTAENGVDYESIPDFVTIPAGETSVDLIINTIGDELPEGIETFELVVTTNFGCAEEFEQVVSLEIHDEDPLLISDDVSINAGDFAILEVSGGGFNYFWNPLYNISGATSANPTVFPDTTTTYVVTSVLGDCFSQESVTVFVNNDECDANAFFMAETFCNDESAFQLMAAQSGGVWSGTGVNGSGVFNPQNVGPGTYEITHIITIDAECADTSIQNITINAVPNANFSGVSICVGDDPVTLNAQQAGGTWSGMGVDENGVFNTAGLAPGNYSISYSITTDDGCAASSTQTVSIIETANAMFTVENFCASDGAAQLMAVTPGGTWSGPGVNSSGVFTPSSLAPGEYEITHTIGAGACSNSSTEIIRVLALPNSSFTSISLCQDDASQQLQAVTAGGSWSGSGVDAQGLFNPSSLSPGSYPITYSVISAEGCSSSTTLNVSVLNAGDATFQSATYCVNSGTYQLTANTSGGTWSGSGVSVDGFFNTGTVGVGNYSITYTLPGAESCGGVYTGTITVSQDADAAFIPEDFCENGPSSNLVPIQGGGTWSGTGVSSTGVFDPTGLQPGGYAVTYSLSTNAGCSASSTQTINVYPLPNSSFQEVTVCSGSGTVQLNAEVLGGVWEGTAVDANGVWNPSGLSAGTYTVSYTVTGQGGCIRTSTRTLTVAPSPSSSFPDQSLCADAGPTQLDADVSGGVWSGAGVTSSGMFDPAGLTVGTYQLTYIVTNSQGCSATSTGNVSILDLPNSNFITQDFCVDDMAENLVPFIAGGTWSGSGIDANGIFDPSVGPGVYPISYAVTTAQGCSSSTTLNVEVYMEPDASFISENVCVSSGPIPFVANMGGGAWSGPGINGGGIFDPAITGAGSFDITYSISGTGGCSASTTQTISVYASPDATFTAQDFCESDAPTQLSSTLAGGSWIGDGVSGTGEFDPSIGAGSYNITYEVEDANFCDGSFSAQITVYALPDPSFTPQNFCVSDEATALVATTDGGSWSGDGISDDGVFDPAGGAGNYEITYSITDANGCTDSSTETVEVYALPDPSFAPQNFCVTDEATALVATTGGGSWSGDGISDDGVFDPTTGVGTYEITYTIVDANGCSDSSSETVEVYGLPDSGFESVSVCHNAGAVQLLAVSDGGSWSGIGVDESGMFSADGLDGGAYEITHTVISDEGCSSSTTIEVNVNPAIEFTVTQMPECDGVTGFFSYVVEISGGTGADYEVNFSTASGSIDTLVSVADAGGLVGLYGQGLDEVVTVDINDLDSPGCTASYEFASPFCITCSPDAGTLAEGPETICAGDDLQVLTEGADASTVDTLVYVLHTGSTLSQEDALEINTTGLFNGNGLDYNTAYYVTAVATVVDDAGALVWEGECFDASNTIEAVFLAPLSVGFEIDCDEDSGIFSVIYTLSGGLPSYDAGSFYSISGDLSYSESDQLEEGAFIIQDYSDGNFLNLIATDANGCSFAIDEGPISCSKCGTEAGVISQEPIYACSGEPAQAEATDFSQFGLPLVYFMHTDTINPPGEILAVKDFSSAGYFEFEDLEGGEYSTEYFLSAYIGQLDADGVPDFEALDNCTVFMPGPKVVFLEPISVFIDPDCDFENNGFNLVMVLGGGYPAYDPTSNYSINVNDGLIEGVSPGGVVYVSPLLDSPSDYTVIVDDITDCGAAAAGGSTIECEIGLSVELLDFRGLQKESGNQLLWSTASEYDNDFYTLEFSLDGRNFESISDIDAVGNSNTREHYTYFHDYSNSGLVYYRLKIVDNNGDFEYSNVVTMERKGSLIIGSIGPIPADQYINIEIQSIKDDGELVLFNIVDLAGKQLSSQTFELNSGINNVQLETGQYAAGVYVLQIQGSDVQLTQQIVVD